MRWRDAAALAMGSLRSFGARTLLTVLGLAVGVAAVLTVQALGTAGEDQVEREIDRMGVNRVWAARSDGGEVTAQDVRIAAAAAGAPVCAGAAGTGAVTLGATTAPAALSAFDGAMQAVHHVDILAGRAFLPVDHEGRRAVCIVDETLAQELDVAPGQRVLLGGRMFTVVGVAQALPASAMAVLGVAALPLSAWEDTFASGAREMTIAVPAGADAAAIAGRVSDALGEAFRVNTLAGEVAAARHIVEVFVGVLACVGIVCMITGGVGVMNVMLLSVRQRRREIGLMKALGATAGQVGWLFLLEAAGYALLGGLCGIALGAALTALCALLLGLTAALTVASAAQVLTLAALVGLASGVAPAIGAARLEVVDALRQQ